MKKKFIGIDIFAALFILLVIYIPLNPQTLIKPMTKQSAEIYLNKMLQETGINPNEIPEVRRKNFIEKASSTKPYILLHKIVAGVLCVLLIVSSIGIWTHRKWVLKVIIWLCITGICGGLLTISMYYWARCIGASLNTDDMRLAWMVMDAETVGHILKFGGMRILFFICCFSYFIKPKVRAYLAETVNQ